MPNKAKYKLEMPVAYIISQTFSGSREKSTIFLAVRYHNLQKDYYFWKACFCLKDDN